MASVKICDGRTSLFRYDVGVQLEMCGCSKVTECHFVTAEGVIKRDVVNNICNVPDAALMQAGVLVVYAFSRTADEGTTRHEFRLLVQDRPKPADYIDPPDESDTLDLIVQRVTEQMGGVGAEVDPTVPSWAKQPEPPKYTAQDVGALPVDAIKASVSGAVVSVTDAAARPAVGLVSQIVAVQEGEGDPSPDNVRPIRGWDRVQVKNDTSGQTLTADLPETVYGGNWDWVTGVLTVTHAQIVLDGTEAWRKSATNASGYAGFYISISSGDEYGEKTTLPVLSTHYPYIGSWSNSVIAQRAAKLLYVKDSRITNLYIAETGYDTADEFAIYLAEQYATGTPVEIVYELAQPYTIQLTPQQLDMLKSANNLWSDTGDTSVVYVADLQMYIDNRIAALAAASI